MISPDVVSRSVPWWIILVAVLAGVLLLLLIVLVLYKCKFFQRKRPPTVQAERLKASPVHPGSKSRAPPVEYRNGEETAEFVPGRSSVS